MDTDKRATQKRSPRAAKRLRMACWGYSLAIEIEQAPPPQQIARLWSVLPPSVLTYLQEKITVPWGWWGRGRGCPTCCLWCSGCWCCCCCLCSCFCPKWVKAACSRCLLGSTTRPFPVLLPSELKQPLVSHFTTPHAADVGVQGRFLWTWGGGRSGDFPWPAGCAESGSALPATPRVSRLLRIVLVVIPTPASSQSLAPV